MIQCEYRLNLENPSYNTLGQSDKLNTLLANRKEEDEQMALCLPFCCCFSDLLRICRVLSGNHIQNGSPGFFICNPDRVSCHGIKNTRKNINRKDRQAGLNSGFDLDSRFKSYRGKMIRGC
jgi:hypothetical protein